MTVGELKEGLDKYPDSATLQVGVSIPDLFINTMANATLSGNALKSEECNHVRLVATVPNRRAAQVIMGSADADANNEGTVQEG